MANRRLLAIGAGLAMGADKAATNLITVMKAKHQMDQQKQMIDLKKQAIENDISLESWLRDAKTKQLDMEGKKIDADSKMAGLKAQQYESQVNELNAKVENIKGIIAARQKLEGAFFNQDNELSLPEGIDIDFGGGVGVSRKVDKKNDFDKDLTDSVVNKLTDPDKSDEDFQLDLEDLKNNSSLYEKAGVNVGLVMNKAMKHEKLTPNKKSIFEKLGSAWKTLTE